MGLETWRDPVFMNVVYNLAGPFPESKRTRQRGRRRIDAASFREKCINM